MVDYYRCKLEHHLRCDMDGNCQTCIKTENDWAEAWITSYHNTLEPKVKGENDE